MQPFFIQQRNAKPTDVRRLLSLADLAADAPAPEVFRNHDTPIKFWVSTPVYDALEHMAKCQGDTISAWLRGFFAMHCYGTYVVSGLLKQQSDLFKDADTSGIRYSVAAPPQGHVSQPVYFVPELGKNVAPVKVWISKSIREDIALLSTHAKISLSQYCRETITARLLGHGTLPMRPEMLKAEPDSSLADWEAEESTKLKYRRVEQAEYEKTRFGYEASEWVQKPASEISAKPVKKSRREK